MLQYICITLSMNHSVDLNFISAAMKIKIKKPTLNLDGGDLPHRGATKLEGGSCFFGLFFFEVAELLMQIVSNLD